MKVLSLFDGISCGMVAMQRAGVEVEKYDAFEIDKYAIQVSEKNYPEIAHHGDVFQADFKPFQGCDWLIGGSPCVFWSIAQSPNKRETKASGKGWELFSQYLRALQEAKPTYFLYENNDSMSDDIRDSITETFGFEPIMIDSALLSGQHRKRLYWIGKQSEKGFYEKCRIPLPKDKEILLKDILESGYAWQDKSYCITANYHPTFKSNLKMHKNTMVAEQLLINDDTISIDCENKEQSMILPATAPIKLGEYGKGSQGQRIYSVNGKSVTLSANGGGQGAKTGLYKIDLPDGKYIIRKLTPVEAERLQTLPDNYTKGISNTQRYKCIGNSWTVDVIAYLIDNALHGETEPCYEQLSFF